MTRNTSDTIAFEEIVDRFSDRLFRFAFMRIGVRETAEDMVQDVLLRLYRAMTEGREIRSPEFFLLRSISNACIDHIRYRRPPTVGMDTLPDVTDDTDTGIDEEFRRISSLLDGLPFEQAETVRLKTYDELTFRQIAELQGVAEATVKSRYRYAILQIRRCLAQEKE